MVFSGKPNQYLILPPGFESKASPHGQSPVFKASKDALETALCQIITAQPRSVLEKMGDQITVVQRSLLLRFPDTAVVQFFDDQNGGNTLAIFSQSKYGRSDLGVNKKRVEGWLGALKRDFEIL